LAPFLEKTSRDRAPGRFADFLLAPKHAKADVLLTTNMVPLRCAWQNEPWSTQLTTSSDTDSNCDGLFHTMTPGSDSAWQPIGALNASPPPLFSPPRRHWACVQRASLWSLQELAASSRKAARPHPQVWFLLLLLFIFLSAESYWEEPPR